MSYTVTIITALGRTLSRTVETLDEARHAINTTHMARYVALVDNTTGEHWAPEAIEALAHEHALSLA